jgi:hypothetical protein
VLAQCLGETHGFRESHIVIIVPVHEEGERQVATALIGEAASALASTVGGASSR